jgi:hypothetical protein
MEIVNVGWFYGIHKIHTTAFLDETLECIQKNLNWSQHKGGIFVQNNINITCESSPYCHNPNLGLATKAKGLAKVWAKTKPGSRILMPMGVQKSVRERTLTLPSELPCWELESR